MPTRIFKVRNQRRSVCALISIAVINELLGLSGLSPEELEEELRPIEDQEQDGSTDEKTDKIYEQNPKDPKDPKDPKQPSRLKLAIRKIFKQEEQKFDELNGKTNNKHAFGFTYDQIIELFGQKANLEARLKELYWPPLEAEQEPSLLDTFKSFIPNPFKPFGMMVTGIELTYFGHSISITVLAPNIIILFDSQIGEMKRYTSFEELLENEKDQLGKITKDDAVINHLFIDVIPVRPELLQKISAHGAVAASAVVTVAHHAITSNVSPNLEAPTTSPAPHLTSTGKVPEQSEVSAASRVKTARTVRLSRCKRASNPRTAKNTPITTPNLLVRILQWLKSVLTTILNAIKNFYKDSEDQNTTLRSSEVVRSTHAMPSALKSAVESNRNGLPTRRARFASSDSVKSLRPKLVQR